jgi:RNA polymerase sigma-70 factor (sigma-E family)
LAWRRPVAPPGSGSNRSFRKSENMCNRVAALLVGVSVEETEDLMVQAATPSDRNFADFYRAEYPGMVRLAVSLTGDPDRSEDVVQDAFTRIHGRFSSLERPGGYLRTAVVNLCRDQQRRGLLEHRQALRPPDGALSLEASEMIDVLLRLPFKQRAVLVLRYWGDWTEEEIAKAVGCRPGSVKSHASRGLAALRKEVAR